MIKTFFSYLNSARIKIVFFFSYCWFSVSIIVLFLINFNPHIRIFLSLIVKCYALCSDSIFVVPQESNFVNKDNFTSSKKCYVLQYKFLIMSLVSNSVSINFFPPKKRVTFRLMCLRFYRKYMECYACVMTVTYHANAPTRRNLFGVICYLNRIISLIL